MIALTALNVVSTLLECGFGACPDNPVDYELLKAALSLWTRAPMQPQST